MTIHPFSLPSRTWARQTGQLPPRTGSNSGRCTLVGAGPGDPDLLTVKAVKAIQSATVLLVDDLVSDEVVALAPPGARIVWVGKRGGCQSTPQAFIERCAKVSTWCGSKAATRLCLAAAVKRWSIYKPLVCRWRWSTASPPGWRA